MEKQQDHHQELKGCRIINWSPMKYLLKLFLVAVLVFAGVPTNACSCLSTNEENWLPVVQRELSFYPIVFIGEVLFPSSYEGKYSVRVVDSFKGEAKVDAIMSISTSGGCSMKPSAGLGIFYAQLNKDGTLDISECSISRNLNFLSKNDPRIVVESTIGKPVDLDEVKAARQPLLLKNWMNEYILLNAYRNNHLKAEEPQTNNPDYLSYLAVALSLMAVLVAFFRKQR
ncbi:hypothetical protein [Sabulibacter ruber]|uniref:hypothetical protein n=1 Tax=Sabulibacter ruber TaxID=2811901 RepID=UPI001A977051|nr:hypothetical protein [Sabulibacter ruber]